MRKLTIASVLSVAVALIGCEQKPEPAKPPTGGPSSSTKKDNHAGHDHVSNAEENHGTNHGGDIIELGSTKFGDLTVRASRDTGELPAGGDAPIDVWLTTADGKPATVTAVRFWIGTEDAKGSVKSKADIEDPKEPNHWHAHAEVPNPMPEGSKLWVEVEGKDGKKSVGSLDLKK